jgi:PAS domain S-box-containing protein
MILAKRELRAERDRFEALMEAVPAAICSFRLDADGHITMPYASPRIEAIYGITPHVLATDATGVFSAIHRDDIQSVQKSIAESAKTMTLWRDEYRVQSPVLGEIWVESCSAPVRQSDGSVLWHGYVNDVTERKRLSEALRASERRLRLALEAAGSIAFTWDVTNDVVTRYFSTEPALPITGKQTGTLDEVRSQVHPDDLPGFDAQLSACLRDGTEYHNTYRIIRPDGTTINLEEYGYLDRSDDDSPLCLTGISIDVTKREAATEALRVSEARYR